MPVGYYVSMAGWLTVPEVAGLYRVSERTIYRWYKSGRLKPVKIGREWLLAEDQDRPSEARSQTWKGHILALVDSLDQARALESHLLALGRERGGRLFRGQWRGSVTSPDVDLGAVLRSGGPSAVLDIWRHEVAAAAREGRPLFAVSDPPPRDFHPPETLLDYERACNQIDLGEGSVICPYRCDDLTGSELSQLLYAHNGVYLPWGGGWCELRKRTPT